MLETIAIVIIVLWLLGLVSGVAGSLIHTLLIIAIVLLLVRWADGRSL